MVFTQVLDKYGQKLYIKMLSTKEALEMTDKKEDEIFDIATKITLDANGKQLFKNSEEFKASIPPVVVEEIISLSVGNKKKDA